MSNNTPTFFPNGYPNGVSLRGMPVLNNYAGNVYWVNQTTGTDAGGKYGTQMAPFASLTFALSQCVDGRGDIILLAPGYAETVSTAGQIVINKSNVAIISQ